MSAEDKTDLLEAMIQAAIEAAADAVQDEIGRVDIPTSYSVIAEVAIRAGFAAALSVCDVREEWRAGAIYTTRLVFSDWHDAAQIALDEREPDVRYERRLVITTPATEVSDAVPTSSKGEASDGDA